MAAGISLSLPGALGPLLFIALMLLGLYVYLRLFLAVPAVMIDGYGPDEALVVSWRLMRGAMLSTGIAVGLVIVSVIVVIIPLFAISRSLPIASIAAALFGDTVIVSMQAFLYSKLAESSELDALTDMETGA
jgi:membrane-anchored glycerophosphoryl diester phosphodiesterase (GDPDase)